MWQTPAMLLIEATTIMVGLRMLNNIKAMYMQAANLAAGFGDHRLSICN